MDSQNALEKLSSEAQINRYFESVKIPPSTLRQAQGPQAQGPPNPLPLGGGTARWCFVIVWQKREY